MDSMPIETGFAELSIPAPTDVRVLAPQPDLDVSDFVRIARLMVMNTGPAELVLRRVEITQEQFDKWVRPHSIYQNAYNTFLIEWESPLSTKQRIAIQAAAVVEDSIPEIALRIADGTVPLGQVIEALKALAKFAGVGEEKQEIGESGTRFTINITTSTPEKTIEGSAIRLKPEGESPPSQIRIEPPRTTQL